MVLFNNTNTVLHKAYAVYREGGAAQLVARSAVKIGRSIFQTNSAVWFMKDLGRIEEFKPSIPASVDLGSSSEVIDWLRSRKESWLVNPREIESARKYGHIFGALRYQDRIIGVLKIGFNKVYIADYGREIAFPSKVAFFYETFILPEFRGMGLAPFIKTEAMKFLKQKGFVQVRNHVPPWNIPSIRVSEKMEFTRIKTIRCVRIFGCSILTGNPVQRITVP